jgi:hypothetical protein
MPESFKLSPMMSCCATTTWQHTSSSSDVRISAGQLTRLGDGAQI